MKKSFKKKPRTKVQQLLVWWTSQPCCVVLRTDAVRFYNSLGGADTRFTSMTVERILRRHGMPGYCPVKATKPGFWVWRVSYTFEPPQDSIV